MYRINKMSSGDQPLRLLVFTDKYEYGLGTKISATLYEVGSDKSRVVNGVELYDLIGAGEIVFGTVLDNPKVRVCTLCSFKAAQLYKGYRFLGIYAHLEFFNLVSIKSKLIASEWWINSKITPLYYQSAVECGILSLDNAVTSETRGICHHMTLFNCPLAEDNGMTNILDYFLTYRDGIDYFLDGLHFFVRVKLGAEYFACGYKLPNKYLLEVI